MVQTLLSIYEQQILSVCTRVKQSETTHNDTWNICFQAFSEAPVLNVLSLVLLLAKSRASDEFLQSFHSHTCVELVKRFPANGQQNGLAGGDSFQRLHVPKMLMETFLILIGGCRCTINNFSRHKYSPVIQVVIKTGDQWQDKFHFPLDGWFDWEEQSIKDVAVQRRFWCRTFLYGYTADIHELYTILFGSIDDEFNKLKHL
jgi:hypothetical protein